MFILVGICLYHGYKTDGIISVLKILGGIGFGLLLEYATIKQIHAYEYGRFPLMLFNEVPLSIGMGWGVIIYSAGLYTDTLNVKNWLKPVVDAFFALNIDLAMDTVAVRIKMWDWGIPMDSQFFGVKWGNFWAWFWVVLCFSLAFRYFSKSRYSIIRYLSPVIAIFAGTTGVLATNFFIAIVIPENIYHYVVIVFLLSVFILMITQRPKRTTIEIPYPAIIVPMAFHLYFLITGFISGALFNPIYILVICLTMILIVIFIQRDNYSNLIKR